MNTLPSAIMRNLQNLAGIALFLIFLARPTAAQAQTWSGLGGDSNWSTSGNWVAPAPTPGGSSTTNLLFNNSSALQRTVDNQDAATFSVGTLTVASTVAGQYTLNGGTLQVYGAPSTSYLQVAVKAGTGPSSNGTETINNNIKMMADAAFDADYGSLVVNGGIDITGTSTGFLNRHESSTATLTLNGVISGTAGGAVSGIVFNASSAGSTFVNGNNTFTGSSYIWAANVYAGNSNAFGASTNLVNLGTSTGANTGSLLINGAYTIANQVTLASTSGTNNETMGGATADNSTFSGPVYLDSFQGTVNALTVTAVAGGTVTFSGGIKRNLGGTGATGTGDNLTKTGAGTVILSGTNTYQGTTSVNAGTLLITGGSTSGGAYSVASGATFGGAGGTITTLGNVGVTLGAGSKLSVSGNGAVTAGLMTLNLGTGSLDVSAAVAGSSSALTFVLGTAHDGVKLGTGSTLTIGTGQLEFDDFVFSAGSGLASGTYVLFDTSATSGTIVGSLGTNLTGTVGGFGATLALSTDASGFQDIIVTLAAVPEPSSMALCGIGILACLGLGACRRFGFSFRKSA